MIDLLHMAAETARNIGDPQRSFWLGAVAVRRDGAIVKSANGSAYIPFPSAHAEARVLKKAGMGATLYVARVSKKDNSIVLSRPCNSCWLLMKSYRIDKCYYTISDHEYGTISFKNGNVLEKIRNTKKSIELENFQCFE